MMRTFLSRLLGLCRRNALDARLDEDVQTHLDALAAEYERRDAIPSASDFATPMRLNPVAVLRND
jgi:hypothetical protein